MTPVSDRNHRVTFQRTPQGLAIELAFQSQATCDVISLVRPLELVQEPQPLLRK